MKDDESINEMEKLVSANGRERSTGMRQSMPKCQLMVSCCLGALVLIFSGSIVYCYSFSGKNFHRVESSPTHKNVSAVHRYRYRDDHIAARQLDSFRNGTGIIYNLHITHHGGTTVCNELGVQLKHPSFACMGARPQDGVTTEDFPWNPKKAWDYTSTASNIAFIRRHFRLIATEWRHPPSGKTQFLDTHWEHPDLVSVLVLREPISRALAGDGGMAKKYPLIWGGGHNASLDEWWRFAREEKEHNNNYALRILSSDRGCCEGSETKPRYLEKAKKLVQRFTFVLDLACLRESLEQLAALLGLELKHGKSLYYAQKPSHKTPLEERIPYPKVLQYLKKKNKLDIELYEWSRSLSLVDCQALEAKKFETGA